MATSTNNTETTAVLDKIAGDVLDKTKDKRTKLAASFVAKGWAFVLVRMQVGGMMQTEYQALRSAYIAETGSDKNVPTDDLTARVLETWAALGVRGYSWDAVADWAKANDAHKALSPEFRKALGEYGGVSITTLKDAAQVPVTASETKDGKPVPPREEVLAAVIASGETTDKAQRAIIKTARNGGVAPDGPKAKTLGDQIKAVEGKTETLRQTFPAFERGEDGSVLLSQDELNDVILFGVLLRDEGGSCKDLRKAYGNVIAQMTAVPTTHDDVAGENDGSGADDSAS